MGIIVNGVECEIVDRRQDTSDSDCTCMSCDGVLCMFENLSGNCELSRVSKIPCVINKIYKPINKKDQRRKA